MPTALRKVISGGQTGVDQAALRAAQKLGLKCDGWCPPGRECESGVAGPSEGNAPGIGDQAYSLLVEVEIGASRTA